MRFVLLALAGFFATPLMAAPTDDWSARIRSDGLAATEAALVALPAPTPDDLFVLGGVHFLRGIEQALHLRWTVGATGELAPLALLRLALPANPAPEPYRATLVSEVFAGVLTNMDKSAAALARIGDADDVGVTLRLDDLWFDIDGNGSKGEGEALMPLALSAFLNPWEMPETPGPVPVVRFDTADAAWLAAYAHLISALSEFTLAYDPTKATEAVLAGSEDKRTRLGAMPTSMDMMLGQDGAIDKAMIAILALRQTPAAARTQAAKADLLAMISHNRTFWTRVSTETDNEAEWIPNGSQTGAFGITLPPETGARWMGVLTDLEAMLNGQLLVAHWALPAGSGIDIGKFLDAPAPLDVLGWIHGLDALPFARKGPVVSGESWRSFESIIGGNSLLYAFYLN